jgi:hypothetical protein
MPGDRQSFALSRARVARMRIAGTNCEAEIQETRRSSDINGKLADDVASLEPVN